MKGCRQIAILIFGMMTTPGALAQSGPGMPPGALMQPELVVQATVCDIVNNPVQFEGKPVRVRAWVSLDIDHDHQFWMNEVTMRSGRVCQFLRTRFSGQASLGGSTGFGTFTGRIVREATPLNFEASGSKVRLVFVVEQASDVYGLQDLNGLVRPLQLYDKQTGAFIKPQHTVHVAIRCDAPQPIPGTSAMKVSCFDTDFLPVNYDDVSPRMVFRP